MDTSPPTPAPGETLDRLAGDWWVFQLRRGHRYSTDDVLTAWTGWRSHPQARSVLDLGAGVGSVGLLALLRLPLARLTQVEVQSVSAGLARKTVAYNGLGGRVRLVEADLRDPMALEPGTTFDLVVANPPYLPPGSALHSPYPQRAAARIELHGDIFDYCRAAARYLAPTGRFCFSHAAADPRPEQAVTEVGLGVLERREVVFRIGRPPVIALYVCGWEGERRDLAPLEVRACDGQRTQAHRQILRDLAIVA